jgi:TonB family protein
MISTQIIANLLPASFQAAGVVVAAALLPWLFRLDVAGVRYTYWRSVALLCLALPWIQTYQHVRPAATSAPVAVTTLTTSIRSGPVVASAVSLGTMALTVVVIGIVLRLAWLALGVIKLRRLRRAAIQSQPASVDDDLQCALGTHADIRYTAGLQQPVTFGIRRPLVLLPETMRHQSPEIQRAVVGHELLHVKRRDWAWLIVEEIVVCLFWFHPASWWLASRIQCAREEVVDELAIQLTGRRKTYVEALLAFADSTTVVPTAAFARRRHLVRRIALVTKEDVMSSRRIVATSAAMALIVGTGCWFSVAAFPLRAAGQGVTSDQMNPGPLELRAHTVTPENPIPRRVHYEGPVLPDFVASAHGAVQVKVTLDDAGRVAEARLTGLAFAWEGISLEWSEVDLRERGTRIMEGTAFGQATNPTAAAKRQEAYQAFVDAAVTSVRQWRYDPPFEAPLTFTVQVPVGAPMMEFKAASVSVSGALRVGGNIKPPAKIKDVRPVYPPLAREAGVIGVVIIEVRIGTDGSVEEAHVLKSIPLLDQAALDAVKQWEFVPTWLNGAPVPIIMTVTINFAQ